MFKRGLPEAATNQRDGVLSRLLLTGGDEPGAAMNVSWVEVEPGSSQEEHTHDEEQAYLVVSGRGLMRVGGEEVELEEGGLAHVPSGVPHGLANASGDEGLVYVTVAPASGGEVL